MASAMKTRPWLTGLISAAFFLGVVGASADDHRGAESKLSDQDFYRAVACGADPGGPCTTPIVKWPKDQRHTLQIFIHEPPASFVKDKAKAVIAAVRLAATEVNISGADIQLEVVNTPTAPLHVYMLDAGWGDRITDSGDPILDGAKMRATASAIQVEAGTDTIERASIAVSDTVAFDIIRAAVLKAILKALGFQVAIDDPHYTGNSVFAALGHDVYAIRRQDMLALRMHYPTGCEKASECLDR